MKKRTYAAAGLVIAASTLTLATPAQADVGDGSLACNVGEICLAQDFDGSYEWQKHFWWDANYDGYYFTSVKTGASGGPVRDQVSSVKNRDTQCSVRLYNDRGIFPA
jgi:hypothetical protein